MNNHFGLNATTLNSISSVLLNHPQVEQAILYGSHAKGNYKNGSDINLTLVGSHDLDLSVLSKIIRELDDLLLPYMIDISIYHLIQDPDLIDHIQRVGILMYQKGEPVLLTT
jgi:predicted nucleotidyltransferase